jgi:hypothetical protein
VVERNREAQMKETQTNPLIVALRTARMAVLSSLEAQVNDYGYTRKKLQNAMLSLANLLSREAKNLEQDENLPNSLGVIQGSGPEIDVLAGTLAAQAAAVKRLTRAYRHVNPLTTLPEFPLAGQVLMEQDAVAEGRS